MSLSRPNERSRPASACSSGAKPSSRGERCPKGFVATSRMSSVTTFVDCANTSALNSEDGTSVDDTLEENMTSISPGRAVGGQESLDQDSANVSLPTFIVIGAAKSGTTSLCEYLRIHPQVFVSEPKEPQFFPLEFNWDKGLEWYASHFADAGEARAIGEGSTTYTRYPHSKGVPDRMHSLLPRVKLIYLVRHPIERMISQYQQHVWHGWESERSIERALRKDVFYTDISRYATQIEQYLRLFPKEQLLAITSELLRTERDTTLRRVCEFIGVDADVQLTDVNRTFNETESKRKPRMLDALLRRLPGYGSIASHVPEPMRKAKYYLTTRGTGRRPTISADLRRELEDRLRDEVARLHAYMDPGFDGWGIA